MTTTTEYVIPHYTYEDYVKWEGRWELLKGTAIMSPSPLSKHQLILSNISDALIPIKRIFTVLIETDFIISRDTTLRPDIAVYKKFDAHKQKYPTHETPPLLAFEILSPATDDHDRINKAIEYRAAGVHDYLIIDPEKETIEVVFGNPENFLMKSWYKFEWAQELIKLDEIFDY